MRLIVIFWTMVFLYHISSFSLEEAINSLNEVCNIQCMKKQYISKEDKANRYYCTNFGKLEKCQRLSSTNNAVLSFCNYCFLVNNNPKFFTFFITLSDSLWEFKQSMLSITISLDFIDTQKYYRYENLLSKESENFINYVDTTSTITLNLKNTHEFFVNKNLIAKNIDVEISKLHTGMDINHLYFSSNFNLKKQIYQIIKEIEVNTLQDKPNYLKVVLINLRSPDDKCNCDDKEIKDKPTNYIKKKNNKPHDLPELNIFGYIVKGRSLLIIIDTTSERLMNKLSAWIINELPKYSAYYMITIITKNEEGNEVKVLVSQKHYKDFSQFKVNIEKEYFLLECLRYGVNYDEILLFVASEPIDSDIICIQDLGYITIKLRIFYYVEVIVNEELLLLNPPKWITPLFNSRLNHQYYIITG